MSKFGDAIKKINSKLASFERRGLTGTWEYQELRNRAATIAGDNLTIDAQGHTKIIGKGMSPQQRKQVFAAANTKITVAGTEARLAGEKSPDFVKPEKMTRKQRQERRERIRQQAAKEDEIHSFIERNKNDLYRIEYFNDMIKSGKPLSASEWQELQNYKDSALWQQYDLQRQNEEMLKGQEISAAQSYALDMLDSLRRKQSDMLDKGQDIRAITKQIVKAEEELQKSLYEGD